MQQPPSTMPSSWSMVGLGLRSWPAVRSGRRCMRRASPKPYFFMSTSWHLPSDRRSDQLSTPAACLVVRPVVLSGFQLTMRLSLFALAGSHQGPQVFPEDPPQHLPRTSRGRVAAWARGARPLRLGGAAGEEPAALPVRGTAPRTEASGRRRLSSGRLRPLLVTRGGS